MSTSEERGHLATRLRERIIARLALGLIRPGEQLPSARDLAKEYDTDPRAVLDAFRQLERDDLVKLRSRSGVYVSTGTDAQLERRSSWLATILHDALLLGTSIQDVPMLIDRALRTLNIRVVIIDCNADELWSTQEELLRNYGIAAKTFLLPEVSGTGRFPEEVRQADLLLTTQAHQDAVGRIASLVGANFLPLEVNAELFAELGRVLPSADVHFVVSDEVYALKARYILSELTETERLHTYVLGRNDLSEIPDDGAVYVSPRARHLLANEEGTNQRLLAGREYQNRLLSNRSSHALLNSIVLANLSAYEAMSRAKEVSNKTSATIIGN